MSQDNEQLARLRSIGASRTSLLEGERELVACLAQHQAELRRKAPRAQDLLLVCLSLLSQLCCGAPRLEVLYRDERFRQAVISLMSSGKPLVDYAASKLVRTVLAAAPWGTSVAVAAKELRAWFQAAFIPPIRALSQQLGECE